MYKGQQTVNEGKSTEQNNLVKRGGKRGLREGTTIQKYWYTGMYINSQSRPLPSGQKASSSLSAEDTADHSFRIVTTVSLAEKHKQHYREQNKKKATGPRLGCVMMI